MTRAAPTIAIRRTVAADATALFDVSRRADALFAQHGFPQIPALPPGTVEEFARFLASDTCLTATLDGRPVGFALLGEAIGMAWLREIAVDPDFGRRGVGTMLLEAVVDEARRAGHPSIGLTTFRTVPFNAPFYARRGFVEIVPGMGDAEWLGMIARESPPGIDSSTRTLMLRRIVT